MMSKALMNLLCAFTLALGATVAALVVAGTGQHAHADPSVHVDNAVTRSAVEHLGLIAAASAGDFGLAGVTIWGPLAGHATTSLASR